MAEIFRIVLVTFLAFDSKPSFSISISKSGVRHTMCMCNCRDKVVEVLDIIHEVKVLLDCEHMLSCEQIGPGCGDLGIFWYQKSWARDGMNNP